MSMKWGQRILAFSMALFGVGIVLASSASGTGRDIDWTQYHNYAETTAILKSFAQEYPRICKLYSIGKSFQGKEIWCLEITNLADGDPSLKPGVYIDGNTHAGEVSGAETCLYIIDYLLPRYGQEPRITELLDTRVLYILPKINPDGSDAYLRPPGTPPEPGLKPMDDDDDGLLDEDGPDDLNGDGVISIMRVRDPNGGLITSDKDARLMTPRKLDGEGEWRLIGPEGLDNDNDQRINEDPPGSADTVSNRNYPAYWAPDWVQSGGGPYPLSEPEAKAQIDFILGHPNIALIQAFHTHSGVILRPYCSLGDDHIPAADMRNFQAIGAWGTEITGYPVLSVYNDFTTDKSNPRHGVFVDWAYDFFGAFALTTEIWKAPGETGRSVFEGTDENVAMEWNDKELGGRGFINWQKYDHPQYGEIEIGGWNYNYFTQNPPPAFMEPEWKKNCLFEIKRAALTPLLEISRVEEEDLGDGLFRVTATISNVGYLPTNVTQKAVQNGIAKPVEIEMECEGGELLCGERKTEIGHIPGDTPSRSSSRVRSVLHPVNQKTVKWLVRAKAGDVLLKITARSEKAGTVIKTLKIAK
jgi:hypothetical protein